MSTFTLFKQGGKHYAVQTIRKQILRSHRQRRGNAEVKALGAVDDFNVGLFDVETKQYHTNRFQFPAEIVSLWGTVTTKDGKFYPHIHMSAADVHGSVFGGHLNNARVSATCEMVVDDISEGSSNGFVVERKLNEEVGLNLFEFIN